MPQISTAAKMGPCFFTLFGGVQERDAQETDEMSGELVIIQPEVTDTQVMGADG